MLLLAVKINVNNTPKNFMRAIVNNKQFEAKEIFNSLIRQKISNLLQAKEKEVAKKIFSQS
jgi:hypothetical protein